MLAAGIGDLGLPELLVILVVLVLLFGSAKLADVGGALGKSVREFRHAVHEGEEAPPPSLPMDSASDAVGPPRAKVCTTCGAQVPGDAKYCALCGVAQQVPVSSQPSG